MYDPVADSDAMKSQTQRCSANLKKAVASFCRGLELPHDATRLFKETPDKVARLWIEHFTEGYRMDLGRILGRPSRGPDGSVIAVRDLDFYSMCPHHLLPSHGRAHIAYISTGRLAGFAALAKLVDACGHRLILQEEASQMVAQALIDHLGAKAAACAVEAQHLCLIVRGRSRQSRVETIAFAGQASRKERQELLALVRP